MIPTRRRTAARWLLLAAVIAGVLAMHVLSAADSGGNHQPMAMTSVGAALPALSVTTSAAMVMNVPATGFQAPITGPVPGTQVGLAGGMGMSAMGCCVLFLVSTAGLVLLIRAHCANEVSAADSAGGPATLSSLQRGPPRPGRPRIALSVLRV